MDPRTPEVQFERQRCLFIQQQNHLVFGFVMYLNISVKLT